MLKRNGRASRMGMLRAKDSDLPVVAADLGRMGTIHTANQQSLLWRC